ncbi:MAG: hypothetical protein IJT21_01580 [Synergistaceae bacterium]|nr:hypothetical protein [Synergistaceae bacterium]
MSESEYVRKDLYDSNMQEIRALMAASEARHEKIAADLQADYRVTSTRLDNIERTINLMFSRLSFLVGGITLFFTAVSIIIALLKK